MEKHEQLAKSRAVKKNNACETVLAETVDCLRLQMKGFKNKDGKLHQTNALKFLKAQFTKRIMLGREHTPSGCRACAQGKESAAGNVRRRQEVPG